MVASSSVAQTGLRHQGGRKVLRVSIIWEGTAGRVGHSPGPLHDFKHDEVAVVENGNDDQEHQEQKADEKHNGLNGHSYRSGNRKYMFNQ